MTTLECKAMNRRATERAAMATGSYLSTTPDVTLWHLEKMSVAFWHVARNVARWGRPCAGWKGRMIKPVLSCVSCIISFYVFRVSRSRSPFRHSPFADTVRQPSGDYGAAPFWFYISRFWAMADAWFGDKIQKTATVSMFFSIRFCVKGLHLSEKDSQLR